jgi:hypothetical protein
VTYELLRLGHVIGVVLMGAGLIGVFLADLRSRQLADDLALFAEAIRNIAVFYDGLVVPGALLLLASGAWMIVEFYGGWEFLQVPWLVGMVGLFAFEFIEGNTVTRLYFMRMRRLTRVALAEGQFTAELERARSEQVPTFTHLLDLPILLLIVSLGVVRPDDFTQLFVGSGLALVAAALLTVLLPHLYPWRPLRGSQESS